MNDVKASIQLCENVEAPVEAGQVLGEMTVTVKGEVREIIPLVAGETVNRISIPGIFEKFMHILFMS
ncbi:hypothetical protein SDC9_95584 [bioreactor metagenome]|uniref:Peptidase S11 D-Ala-D-Ala carboxypeptidase A C-terminal domain-containing protein n=1 Tax=bioreactor metagenome TaxID=1076179 RepID=A0A645A721_9ZZZZ